MTSFVETRSRLALRRRLLAILDALEGMHAPRGWHWQPGTSPFEIAVGAILVQNTSWTNVEGALALLRARGALQPQRMAELRLDELETLVRPSGQYRQKARKLQSFLALTQRHGGLEALLALPAETLRAELLATWGIGPETADVIVLYAAKQPAFVIDAYTARVFGRLGLGPDRGDYDAWQRWFTGALDPASPGAAERFGAYHALIVLHAKHLCRKRARACGHCTLAPQCPAALQIRG